MPILQFGRRVQWKSHTGQIFGQIDWWVPDEKSRKTVFYESDFKDILWEQDSYSSGHQYPSADGDGTEFERIVVTFDYTTKRINLAILTDNMSKYSFPLPDDPSQWDPSSKGNENLERARLILQMWGIKRL
jgi:hypothetical protein